MEITRARTSPLAPRPPPAAVDEARPISGSKTNAPAAESSPPGPHLIAGPETGVVNRAAARRSAGLTIKNTPAQLRAQAALRALETTDERPLDARAFGELYAAFRAAPDPAAALEALRKTAPAFAEAAAIYGPPGAADPTGAFLHYAINTGGPVGASLGGSARVLQLAAAYGEQLGYSGLERRGDKIYARLGDHHVELMTWKKTATDGERLRELGRAINLDATGNRTTVPMDRVPIEGARTTYSKNNAYWTAQLSNIAYDDRNKIEAHARAMGFDQFRWIESAKTDSEVFVVANRDAAFVVFRGSTSPKDFLIDAKLAKTPAHGGEVHHGFDEAARSVWPELQRALAEVGDRPVIFTGHSLGAAGATLAAITYAEAGGEVASVYIHGGPRVGNADFAAAYNARLGDRTYLHVDDRDLVTRVPPRWLGYVEVGEKRIFDEDGGVRVVPRKNERNTALPTATADSDRVHAASELSYDAALEISALERFTGKVRRAGEADALVLRLGENLSALNLLPEPIDDHFQHHYARLTGDQVRASLLSP